MSDHLTEPFLIGICGGTCSGKTTICDIIGSNFENDVIIIKQDSYYKGGNINTNFDHPDSLEFSLLINHLKKLMQGEEVDVPVYDFTTHSRKKATKRVKPNKIIVVEGILIFWHEELVNLFDLKVFVDANSVVRYQRRVDRDTNERGRDENEVKKRWITHVGKCHDRFVEPTKSSAHLTIHNSEPNSFGKPPQVVQIDIILTYVSKKISQSNVNVEDQKVAVLGI